LKFNNSLCSLERALYSPILWVSVNQHNGTRLLWTVLSISNGCDRGGSAKTRRLTPIRFIKQTIRVTDTMQVAPGANESSMEIADGAESQKARKPTDVQKPRDRSRSMGWPTPSTQLPAPKLLVLTVCQPQPQKLIGQLASWPFRRSMRWGGQNGQNKWNGRKTIEMGRMVKMGRMCTWSLGTPRAGLPLY